MRKQKPAVVAHKRGSTYLKMAVETEVTHINSTALTKGSDAILFLKMKYSTGSTGGLSSQ